MFRLGFMGWLVALGASLCGRAWAQAPPDLQPVTDRNFTVDVHEGVVFG